MSEGNVSFTAAAVGLGLVTASNGNNFSHLVANDVAKLTDFFVSEGVRALPINIGYAFMKIMQVLPSSLQKGIYSQIVTPGIIEHWALRKLMIDQQVQEAVGLGNTQIVVLGAGYDAQSLIWHKKYPTVKIFEVDCGTTHAIKAKCIEYIKNKAPIAIAKLGKKLVDKYSDIQESLHFIQCDLGAEDVVNVLQNHGFDMQQNTIVIAEGFTMFLTKKQLSEFFPKVSKIVGSEGRFILSFSQPEKRKRVIANSLQKASNENFKSEAMPEDVPELMYKNGFNVESKALFIEMQNQAGNEQAINKHQLNPELPKENYYVVRRSCNTEPESPKSIADIPSIKLNIPLAKGDKT